jgi:hypothetical protein
LAAAAKGISIASTLEIEHWIAESETRLWNDLDLILAAGMTPDGRMLQVSLTSQEYEHADYVGLLKRITEREDISADVPLNRLRNCSQCVFRRSARRKSALFLSDWSTMFHCGLGRAVSHTAGYSGRGGPSQLVD